MEEWKIRVYREVTETLGTPPLDFDKWLEERLGWRNKNGKRLVKDREERVLYEYFRDGKTLQQIGDELVTSREYIRQTKERVIRKLSYADKHMRDYVWDIADDNVFSLPLSNRAANALFANDILKVSELDKALRDGTVKAMRNIGIGTYRELTELVSRYKEANGGKEAHDNG